MAEPSPLSLAAEFPTPTREQWRALVDESLGGAPFEARLVTRTYDGLELQPLYTPEDDVGPDAAGLPGLHPFVRGRTAAQRVVDGWDVRQRHGGPDAEVVNAAVLADLEGGATSILLGPVPDLAVALRDVLVDVAPVCLDWGADTARGATDLVGVWEAAGVPPSATVGELGFDPLGRLADDPRFDAEAGLHEAVDWVRRLAPSRPHVRVLRVDAARYGGAGAADAQEVALALATGVAYLRGLVGAGVELLDALGQLSFTLSATPDQFATVAKLRAARRAWARVTEACGAPAEARGLYLHATTSLAHYAQRDPWVNPLRATLACFGAAVGGADAITVLPMGAAAGVWDDDGRRLARNTQIILLEETQLARVADPAGGSHFVERFTEALAAEAWSRFQEIERRGGMAAVLRDGWAAAAVAETWEVRLRNLARRADPLTGVSEFPDLSEPPLRRDGSGGGGELPFPARPADSPFPLRRLAAPFEALRDAAEAASERPRVFLANLGPPATYTARAGFARNLFEAGGIAAVGEEGYETAEDAAGAYRRSGAPLAVICSSDRVYAEQAEATAAALRAAGARRVYLAGNPGERREAYQAAGVDEFVYVGCDVLDVLQRAHDAAAVAGAGRSRADDDRTVGGPEVAP